MNFSELIGLASGHVEARIVQSAVGLGFFDALESAPGTAHEIAHRLKTEPHATELLLNALAALRLLHKQADAFSLTETATRYLCSRSAHYLGDMIRFEAMLWRSWENLPEAIRTGRAVRPADMYQTDTKETEIFINAMDSLIKARGDSGPMASALDWTQVATMLDVGSGPATYPISLCQRFPQLRATVFDLPATLKITARYVREANMTDRIELIPGNYRNDPISGSYDVIFLSNIIHGEDYQKNQALIETLVANLAPSGRIVIKDHILDASRVNPAVGAIFSILMLLTTDGGRCYSFEEIKTWMTHAGLRQVERIDLPPPLTSSLVIGRK
ncbi:MAG: methyltransferase [Candidatus Binatia bacterium]